MNRNRFCMEFAVTGTGELFCAADGTKTVLRGVYENGCVDVYMLYDFPDKPPLHLRSDARMGDCVRVRVLPYRLEMYVNDVLMDEEWPYGSHCLDSCAVTDNGCRFRLLEDTTQMTQKPAVLGTFRNAEGWKPEKQVFVGDCMPYCHNGVYHVLYLKDRHHHKSKWGFGAHQWSHISTADFDTWSVHPMAVEIDDPTEGSICTGSWFYANGLHYLFYTVRMCDGSPAKICRSVSEDGFHFAKDRAFAFALSDRYTAPSARDPKIIKADAGVYHMLLTTSLKKERRGCLAHLISTNLHTWQELGEPLYIAPEGMGEPECPDYFCKDGWYYLVYSLRGRAYYQYSREPFSGWTLPADPIIPCKSVPKAAIWNDRIIFTGFQGDGVYAGTMTFLEAAAAPDGTLRYQSLAAPKSC